MIHVKRMAERYQTIFLPRDQALTIERRDREGLDGRAGLGVWLRGHWSVPVYFAIVDPGDGTFPIVFGYISVTFPITIRILSVSLVYP